MPHMNENTNFMHAFHRHWTAAVGAVLYDKRPWRHLCNLAEGLPAEPPALREYLLQATEALSKNQRGIDRWPR